MDGSLAGLEFPFERSAFGTRRRGHVVGSPRGPTRTAAMPSIRALPVARPAAASVSPGAAGSQ